MDQNALARKNLDKRLAPLRDAQWAVPQNGWLRAIRKALGMTTRQMADRLGVKQPRIIALEKAEPNGAVTLQTLREAAEALDCTLVYALVPKIPLEDTIRQRATKRADAELKRIHTTMRLENQALTPDDLASERNRLIQAFVTGAPRRLWDQE